MFWEEKKKRKPFSTKNKKMEWMRAASKDPAHWRAKFVKTSKCRKCHRRLRWGDGTYDFDHKDNNPANNSLNNCYLVCKGCHGAVTVVKKRKIKGFLGETVGYETIKKKVGYKKPKKKPKKTKRVAVRDIFGNVIRYRTVKVRKPKTTKKKTTTKKTRRKTKPKRTTRKKKK